MAESVIVIGLNEAAHSGMRCGYFMIIEFHLASNEMRCSAVGKGGLSLTIWQQCWGN